MDDDVVENQSVANREIMVSKLLFFDMTWTCGACTDLDGRAFISEIIKAMIERKKDHFKKYNFVTQYEPTVREGVRHREAAPEDEG